MAKYYGMSPRDIEALPVALFNDYLGNIGAVEKMLHPQPSDSAHAPSPADEPTGGEPIMDVLKRHGVTPPQ